MRVKKQVITTGFSTEPLWLRYSRDGRCLDARTTYSSGAAPVWADQLHVGQAFALMSVLLQMKSAAARHWLVFNDLKMLCQQAANDVR